MGTQPKKPTRTDPKDKKKVPKKGVADAERLQNLLNQVSKAQKPVRPATGRTDKKDSGRRNGDPQVEAARRPPSKRPSSSAFKRLVQRPGKEGQESAAQVASEQEDVEEDDIQDGDGDGTEDDEEEEYVGEVGQEQPGDDSGSEEETEEDTSAKPAPPAKRVKLEQMMVSTSKGKSKREPIDLTVDALQLKRYCIDAVKMFIAEKIVALDELWSAEVVKRKEVDKEIRRLAEYCGVMPAIVDKKMKTHFDGL